MKKILLHLDGSQHSFKALEKAISLASSENVELHTISVVRIPRFSQTIREVEGEKDKSSRQYGAYVSKANEMAVALNYPIQSHILIGNEIKAVTDFIKKESFDLFIVGFNGSSAIYNILMGNINYKLLRKVPCPVLVMK